jgi:hypothetical protein
MPTTRSLLGRAPKPAASIEECAMLRLWITLLLVLLLIGAVVGALTRTEPKRLWAFALGLLCVGLIGGGLLWIFAP